MNKKQLSAFKKRVVNAADYAKDGVPLKDFLDEDDILLAVFALAEIYKRDGVMPNFE